MEITVDRHKFTLKKIEYEMSAGAGQMAECSASGVIPIEINVTKKELLGFSFDVKAHKATREKLAETTVLSTVFP
jgi:hypothetical protein